MSDVMSVRLHLSGVRVRGVGGPLLTVSRGRSGIGSGVVAVPTVRVQMPTGVGSAILVTWR